MDPNPPAAQRASLQWALALAAALIAAGAGLHTAARAAQSAPHTPHTPAAPAAEFAPEAAAELEAGAYTTRTFDWTDTQRARAVPVRLYLPAQAAAGEALPLVVFSHGIGGSRDGYSYLGRHFAARGYASLHVQHVGSDRNCGGGNPFGLVSRLTEAAQPAEALARARDLSYALDRLLELEQRGALGVRLDRARIAAAGHSYGANTTMLAAGAEVELEGRVLRMRDPRIRAAILISAPPFYGWADPAKIVAPVSIPTLHITATGDEIRIPGYFSGVSDRIELYRAMGGATASKALVVFKDGSHSMFTDRAGTGGVSLNPAVKLATREAALAFLSGVFERNTAALDRWQDRYRALLSGFERSLRQ